MAEWKTKRFWKTASSEECDGGFAILLDGRPIKTPAKSQLIVPTTRMADAIAEEWQAQEKQIVPSTMPVTRAANSAIDKVSVQFSEVAKIVSDYADADLICYRAEAPAELAKRQSEAWDPLLIWSRASLNAPLKEVSGIIHAPQSEDSLTALSKRVEEFSPFELTAFHDLVAISGSLIIGFAVTEAWSTPDDLWQRSRVDEQWQIDQWGKDDEAERLAEDKRQAFLRRTDSFDWEQSRSSPPVVCGKGAKIS